MAAILHVQVAIAIANFSEMHCSCKTDSSRLHPGIMVGLTPKTDGNRRHWQHLDSAFPFLKERAACS